MFEKFTEKIDKFLVNYLFCESGTSQWFERDFNTSKWLDILFLSLSFAADFLSCKNTFTGQEGLYYFIEILRQGLLLVLLNNLLKRISILSKDVMYFDLLLNVFLLLFPNIILMKNNVPGKFANSYCEIIGIVLLFFSQFPTSKISLAQFWVDRLIHLILITVCCCSFY